MIRSNKVLIGLISVMVGVLLVVMEVAGDYSKAKIQEQAPAVLALQQFTIVQEGAYSFWTDAIAYTVTKDGQTYQVTVRLLRGGALIIQPN